MSRIVRATASVLAATALVAVAVFFAVSAARAFVPSTVVTAASTGRMLTCPRTGCTASTCHATQGGGPSRGGPGGNWGSPDFN